MHTTACVSVWEGEGEGGGGRGEGGGGRGEGGGGEGEGGGGEGEGGRGRGEGGGGGGRGGGGGGRGGGGGGRGRGEGGCMMMRWHRCGGAVPTCCTLPVAASIARNEQDWDTTQHRGPDEVEGQIQPITGILSDVSDVQLSTLSEA